MIWCWSICIRWNKVNRHAHRHFIKWIPNSKTSQRSPLAPKILFGFPQFSNQLEFSVFLSPPTSLWRSKNKAIASQETNCSWKSLRGSETEANTKRASTWVSANNVNCIEKTWDKKDETNPAVCNLTSVNPFRPEPVESHCSPLD